jgi:hypothetical protein
MLASAAANWARVLASAFRIGTVVAASSWQAAIGDVFDRTDYADIALIYSFTLDVCGDQDHGEMLRKAIAARVESCPFTTDAKQKFRERAAENEARARAQIRQFIELNGGLPERLKHTEESCAEYIGEVSLVRSREHLQRYFRGEISIADVNLWRYFSGSIGAGESPGASSCERLGSMCPTCR